MTRLETEKTKKRCQRIKSYKASMLGSNPNSDGMDPVKSFTKRILDEEKKEIKEELNKRRKEYDFNQKHTGV